MYGVHKALVQVRRYSQVNSFGFFKHLKGNVLRRLENDWYENHL